MLPFRFKLDCKLYLSFFRNSQDPLQSEPHPKRRSLSDLPSQAQDDYDMTNVKSEEDNNNIKVPKLEIRSRILSVPFPPPGSDSGATAERGVRSFSMSSQSSPLSSGKRFTSHLPVATRKSRSSENLSSPYGIGSSHSRMTPRLRSPSPFSFSLTTPASALNSFKFLEVKSRTEVTKSNKPVPRKSLDSSLDRPQKASSRPENPTGLQESEC